MTALIFSHVTKSRALIGYRSSLIIHRVSTSTCSSERSFSYLRHLKSYLRSTMKQKRLNHIATLYIEKLSII
ncbi:hypothetical protein ALC60_04191 [Trachymyrmex zeteki]|uniref:HAT C-terminal dimerisation domain-containing protein n=1 Tax=Mycetomoellerius zeteki TaxID=64791 RepID=A0A151X9A4_9HYME|nr:hypothetical protein ALC60_04191 [Trachymyrmex zeteki]